MRTLEIMPHKMRKPFNRDRARFLAFYAVYLGLYPTEQNCFDDIINWLRAAGAIRCPQCHSTDVMCDSDATVSRTGTCQICTATVWLTAGTFFDHMKSIRAWHAALWLKEHGVVFNANQFAEQVEISASSAWSLLKRIDMVLHAYMEDENRSVASSLFLSVFGRRSRLTPRDEHPMMEEQAQREQELREQGTASEQQPLSEEQPNTDSLAPLEKEIYAQLSDKIITSDQLTAKLNRPIFEISAALTMLEVAGLAHSFNGSRIVKADPTLERRSINAEQDTERDSNPKNKARVKPIIKFIRRIFRSVSRKYLQLYTAKYWFRTHRKQWPIGSLFLACARFHDIAEQEIVDFVSPTMVLI